MENIEKIAQQVTQIFLDVVDGKVNPTVYLKKIYEIKRTLKTPQQIMELEKYLYFQEAA
ncbi:MAG: hypothetical protein AABW56_02825 [Nanoarchaeota archaeon]